MPCGMYCLSLIHIYDMPYAAVDGNVYRVLSRYFGIDVPIDSTEGKKTCLLYTSPVHDLFQQWRMVKETLRNMVGETAPSYLD